MSGSINRVILLGNLGQDPEVRTTSQSAKVVALSIATSDQWKDRNSGERKERTEWHRVVIFGGVDNDGLAGVAEKYLRKGSKVYLSGKLQTRKWEKDGVDRFTTEVVLQGFGAELVLLDRQEGSGRPPPPESSDDYGRTRDASSGRPQAGDMGVSDDDSIPFSAEWRV